MEAKIDVRIKRGWYHQRPSPGKVQWKMYHWQLIWRRYSMSFFFSNTGVSQDSWDASREGDHLGPFLAGTIEKDLRDSSRPNQPIEQDRNIVVVKGHLLAIRSPLHHHLITMRKPHCCLLKRYIICISSSLRLSLSTWPSMFSLLAMEGQRHVNGNLGGSWMFLRLYNSAIRSLDLVLQKWVLLGRHHGNKIPWIFNAM